jgi:hypothetical protein
LFNYVGALHAGDSHAEQRLEGFEAGFYDDEMA